MAVLWEGPVGVESRCLPITYLLGFIPAGCYLDSTLSAFHFFSKTPVPL